LIKIPAAPVRIEADATIRTPIAAIRARARTNRQLFLADEPGSPFTTLTAERRAGSASV